MADMREPAFEIAQLAHLEILTPKLEETLWFFKDLLGMEETERTDESVYLRAYEDFYHHSLKVTRGEQPGLGHVGWRSTSPQALSRVAQQLEGSGQGHGWIGGDRGHGRAYRFATPDGHLMEVLWEVEYYTAPDGKRDRVPDRGVSSPDVGAPGRRA